MNKESTSRMTEMLAPLWSSDRDDDDFSATQAQFGCHLLHKATMISRSHSLRQRRSVEISQASWLLEETRAAEVVTRNLEISHISELESSSRRERAKGIARRLPAREPANPNLRSNRKFRMKLPKQPPDP